MTNIQFLYLHNAKCYDSHVIICGNVIHNKLRDIIYLPNLIPIAQLLPMIQI